MASVHELLTEQFRRWEQRGRGWQVFDFPVAPEPPFVPFQYVQPEPSVDDGRRPTLLSSFVQRLSQKLAPVAPQLPPGSEPEPEPESLERSSLVELQLTLPAGYDPDSFEPFLHSISLCREPLSFELLGQPKGIITQFAIAETDATRVRKQIEGTFPEVSVSPETNVLESAWAVCGEGETAIVEFGLAKEFMLALNTGRFDVLVGIAAALAELQEGQLGLFQVLFQTVREPWRDSILRAIMDADDKPLFVDNPELAKQTADKVSRPLYAAVVRIATRAADFDRAWEIARDMASSLRVFASPTGNELIPLRNDEYPFEHHVEDVVRRQSRRSGMLLNIEELIGFVHLPSAEVPHLTREIKRTKAAPVSGAGLLLGENVHRGKITEVRLSPDQRVRHCHIIGASGTGKSTLLFNMIRQDIEKGEGVALLDPHGDLVDKLLGIIPPDRVEDVILIDPSDEEYSVGFNILSAHSELEKNLLASDLVSVFQRLSTSWGDQMASVLNNAIRAFLESSRGGTLADLRRFLLEPEFRGEFLTTVTDPEIVYYWRKGFAQLSGNKSIGPVLTRLETFLGPKPIRYMVSQRENKLDFSRIMDTGRIVLAKLSQGLIGKENSYLLGSLLVSRFQQTAMSRQAQVVRKDYWLYADEFQNFITPSMAEILAGARKYRLGLILAHQELRQLERDREVAGAVFNCCARIVFRVADDDARKLAEGFSFFEARDIQNLDTGQAICRLERSDRDFNLRVPCPEDSDPAEAAQRRQEVITGSRKEYGTPREEAEAAPQRSQRDFAGPSDSPHAPSRSSAATPTVPAPVTVTPVQATTTTEKPPEILKPTEPALPRDLGRGGAQHKAIQQRLKSEAEASGFHATIEKSIMEGQGSVDLFLERGDQRIACEISVTTTVNHEVGNIVKCLKAGIPLVAVVCQQEGRLELIRMAAESSLGSALVGSIKYFKPDQFVAYLRELIVSSSESISGVAEMQTVRRGRKVTRKVVQLTEEERRQRENTMLKQIGETMKRRASST